MCESGCIIEAWAVQKNSTFSCPWILVWPPEWSVNILIKRRLCRAQLCLQRTLFNQHTQARPIEPSQLFKPNFMHDQSYSHNPLLHLSSLHSDVGRSAWPWRLHLLWSGEKSRAEAFSLVSALPTLIDPEWLQIHYHCIRQASRAKQMWQLVLKTVMFTWFLIGMKPKVALMLRHYCLHDADDKNWSLIESVRSWRQIAHMHQRWAALHRLSLAGFRTLPFPNQSPVCSLLAGLSSGNIAKLW